MDQVEMIDLGGIKQGISIRGNEKNPILLYLHGGPGMAQIGFAHCYQQEWENDFLVVNWDQRGSGLSYHDNVHVSAMTITQLVKDTLELIEYLRKRFYQEKIYLIGHSWGSVLGLYAVQKRPDFFHSFISVGQVVNIQKSRVLSYLFLIEKVRKGASELALEELKEKSIGKEFNQVLDKWVFEFGGVFKQMENIQYLFQSPNELGIYNKEETENWQKGILFSQNHLENELENIEFESEITKIDVPIYFIEGKDDYVTPLHLIEGYYVRLESPKKELIIFEDSAHGPVFEEPCKFNECLKKIKSHY